MFDIEKGKILILDGAMGSELEKHGFDTNTKLWTAGALISTPEKIKAVHRSYLDAGATVLITCSYQATVQGFVSAGYSEEEAEGFLKRAYTIADETCREYTSEHKDKKLYIVTAIGPYGAYLADGSEYRGNYGLSDRELYDFHKRRMEILKSAGASYFACETIPSFQEAKVLAGLLKELGVKGWLTFSCMSGRSICDGTDIEKCAEYLDKCDEVDSIGVNCTKPKYIEELVKRIRKHTEKNIVVYGNAGAEYDPGKKVWYREDAVSRYSDYAESWYEAGADIIGGCCQTGPEEIKEIYLWSKDRNILS